MSRDFNAEKLEPYKAPFSVISLIESIVSREELQLVRSYLGESSIEYCLDLRSELEMFLEIWKEIGEQTEPPTVAKSIDNITMFDPPNAREMLTMQIKLLAQGIQEKNGMQRKGSFSGQEEKVIQYALISQTNTEIRPSTPLRKNNHEFAYNTSPVKLKQVQKSINAKDIDKVADLIRDALQNECKALEYDIAFMQKCIEDEHDLARDRPTSPIAEPPLSKLREVRKALETKTFMKADVDHPLAIPRGSSSSRGNLSNGILPNKLKQSTPPSPNKPKLKPLSVDAPRSNSTMGRVPGLHSLPSSPTQSRGVQSRPLSQTRSNNVDFDSRDNAIPIECWVEPSWTKSMSLSAPGSPDSGVSSRPPTRDLASIQSTLQSLEVTARTDINSDRTASSLGYTTSDSIDYTRDEYRSKEPRRDSEKPSEQFKPIKPVPPTKPRIMPRPPAKSSSVRTQNIRQGITSSRFTRKLPKTPIS